MEMVSRKKESTAHVARAVRDSASLTSVAECMSAQASPLRISPHGFVGFVS